MKGSIDEINIEVNGIDSKLVANAIQDFKPAISKEIISALSDADISPIHIPKLDLDSIKLNSASPRLIRKKLAKEIANSIQKNLISKGESQ